MTPRRRKPENRTLPENLYTQRKGERVYYYFEHPITRQREQLGPDREAAIKTVEAINRALAAQGINPAEKKPKIAGATVSQVIAEVRPKMLAKLKPTSQKSTRQWLDRIERAFGPRPLKSITVRELSDELEPLPDRSYIRIRWHLEAIFAHALARGYLPHNYGNPASVLAKRSEPKTKRERLSLEDFDRIHAKAPEWLRVLMDLMLATTLRPVDVINLRFDQVVDGYLFTEVRKVSKALRIELGEFELSVIRRARDSIVSPYIVHRMPQRKGKTTPSKQKRHPTQLTVDYASRVFSAIRDELGIGDEAPPTLYEIRSLGGKLYKDAGRQGDEIRQLMAHTNQAMTDYYLHDRREVFETVVAKLPRG